MDNNRFVTGESDQWVTRERESEAEDIGKGFRSGNIYKYQVFSRV